MKRKLIQIANSTSVVSLPKDWIEEYKLKKGDELELHKLKNNILIKTNNIKHDEIHLDISNLHYDLVWRYLITAYRKGTETIVIKYSPDFIETLQVYIKDLVGMAVINQKDNTITLKDFFYNYSENDLDNMVHRVFNLVKEMSKDILTAVKEKDSDSLKDMRHRDFNIGKFTNLCIRILNKNVYQNYNKSLSLYRFIPMIEEIGDEYRRIAETYLKDSSDINRNIINIFSDVNGLFDDYYELYYNYDKNKLIEFHKKGNEIINNMKDNYHNKKNSEIQMLSSLNTIVNMIKNICEESLIVNI